MVNFINIQRGQSSNAVAQVAVLKHDFADQRHGSIQGTIKREFRSFLCPMAGAQLCPSSSKESLLAQFEIDRQTAPGGMIDLSSTHPKNLLNVPVGLATVRIRFGEQEGKILADVINIHLSEGRYGWSDAIIHQVADKIARDLKESQVSGVGGFTTLNNELAKDPSYHNQNRLINALRYEFGHRRLPLQEGKYFLNGQ